MIYTAAIDPKLAAIIRGIPSSGVMQFASPVAAGAEGSGVFTCYTAIRMSSLEEWTVRELFAVRTGDDFQIQQKIVMGNISFFDAMHLVASKFQGQIMMGKTTVPDADILTALGMDRMRTLAEVAEKTGQPFDHKGIPMPAVEGQILAEGIFNRAALEVAATTKDTRVFPRSGNYAPVSADELFGLTRVSTPAPAAPAAERIERIALYTAALKSKDVMVKCLEDQIQEKDIGLVMELDGKDVGAITGISSISVAVGFIVGGCGTLLGLPFLPVAAVMPMLAASALYVAVSPKIQFGFAHGVSVLREKRLPDGNEKEFLREFNRMARAVQNLEIATAYMAKYDNNRARPGYLRKAQKHAAKGLTMMKVGVEQRDAILEEMTRGIYPEKGHFMRTLHKESAAWHSAERPLDFTRTQLLAPKIAP